MKPVLSVVIPTYNGETFLASALESIASQSHPEIEIVVVDDGSTDRTLDVVRAFEDRIALKLVRPDRIGNWVAVSNIGLREATGEWACFLHQDDLWLPGRLNAITPLLDSSTTMAIHDAIFVAQNDDQIGVWTCPFIGGELHPEEFLEKLLVQNFIAICAPVFRRAAALESGGLDEELWFTADWDLWLRLGALGSVKYVPEKLAAFRIHPGSQTIKRKLQEGEWTAQLTKVLSRHINKVRTERRDSIERIALASVALNASLAATSRKEKISLLQLIGRFLVLSPAELGAYVENSRIAQRVASRLRVRALRDVHRS